MTPGDASTGGASRCVPEVAVGPPIRDPLGGALARFVWTSSGAVGIGPAAGERGTRLTMLDPSGQVREQSTLWPEHPAVNGSHLAVSGSGLAAAEQLPDETGRNVCSLGIIDLEAATSTREPTRYSSLPNGDTVLGEVTWCDVVAIEDGFLTLSVEFNSDRSSEMTLFARAFDLDGDELGAPRPLLVGEKSVTPLSVTSDGRRAVLAFEAGDDADGASLLVVDGTEVTAVALDERLAVGRSAVTLRAAYDGLLLQTGEETAFIDFGGRLVAGPIRERTTHVAPYEGGFASLAAEEFLVLRTRDERLGAPSAPTGVSWDRRAHGEDLLGAVDGSVLGVLFVEEGELRYATFGCGDETLPLGPPACPEQSEVAPLDDVCEEEVCQLVLRLDGPTLGLKGWAVAGGTYSPVDVREAETIARLVFEEAGQGPGDLAMSGSKAGVFVAELEASDFGGFVLTGAATGLPAVAGGVVWSGRGTYWRPTQWNDPAIIECGEQVHEPRESAQHGVGCDAAAGSELPTTRQALDLALRTNFAAFFASRGNFDAFAMLYTPTVGACDPGVTEFLVVLTRRK
jgi:hypothetical protein